jgi:hypothetical protein
LLSFLLLWAVKLLQSSLLLIVAGFPTVACIPAVNGIPAVAGIPLFYILIFPLLLASLLL